MDLVKQIPAYSFAEASRYLEIPAPTLRYWFHGSNSTSQAPVLSKTWENESGLSFINLVEAYVLRGIRQQFRISMKKVRKAIDYLQEMKIDISFLAHRDFLHDDANIYIQLGKELISLSESGQVVDKEIIERYLSKITYGDDDYAENLSLTTPVDHPKPGVVEVNPFISGGKPCLLAKGVKVESIFRRFKAGESLKNLALDYGASQEDIEEAIRWRAAA